MNVLLQTSGSLRKIIGRARSPRHRVRSGAVTGVLTVATALALAGCSSPSSNEVAGGSVSVPPSADNVDLSGVTLNVGEIGGFTKQFFQAAGALDDVQANFEWKKIGGGAAMFQALSGGAIDASVQGVDPALFSAASGSVPFKVVAIAGKDPADTPAEHGTFWLATRPGLSVTNPADLVGKKIAVSPAKASTPHYFLAKTLKDAGVSINDVEPVFLDSAGALGALLSGQVDAWAGGGATFTQVEAAGGNVIAWSSEHTDNFTVLTVSNQTLADPRKNAAVEDYLKRLIEQYKWTNDDKPAYATVLAGATKLTPDVALTAVNAELPVKFFPLDGDVVQRLQAEADLTYEFGLTDQKVDITDVIDTRFSNVVNTAAQ